MRMRQLALTCSLCVMDPVFHFTVCIPALTLPAMPTMSVPCMRTLPGPNGAALDIFRTPLGPTCSVYLFLLAKSLRNVQYFLARWSWNSFPAVGGSIRATCSKSRGLQVSSRCFR